MNTDSGTTTTRREARIAELDCIIQTEEAKPDPDYQLIDDCIREIGGLEGAKVDFTEEEVAEATEKIFRKVEREKRRKRIVRYAAAAAAVVVLIGGVTACTVNPALVDWLAKIVRMPKGSLIEKESITFVNYGSSVSYNTIDELIEKEGLDLYFPAESCDDINIKRVERMIVMGKDSVFFLYGDPDTSVVVQINDNNLDDRDPNYIDVIEIESMSLYVYKEKWNNNERYIAEGYDGNNKYVLKSNKLDYLYKIITSLKRGQYE